MSNYQLAPFKPWFNVKDFGARGNAVTDDAPAISRAIVAALFVGGGVLFFPPGIYAIITPLIMPINIQGVSFLGTCSINTVLRGFPTATNTLRFIGATSPAAGVCFIDSLTVTASGATGGIPNRALELTNAGFVNVKNCNLTGGTGIYLKGAAFISVENCQIYGGVQAADIGDTGGGVFTGTGPAVFKSCLFGQVPTVAALLLRENWFSLTFEQCMFQASGALTTIQIDGQYTSNVTFINCHGESNFDPTNGGQDFLIGNTAAPGLVRIMGGQFWGHGNGVNYRRYWLNAIRCAALEIHGALASALGNPHGYEGGMIRLGAGYPALGTRLTVMDCNPTDIIGPKYSDAAGRLWAAFAGDIIERRVTVAATAAWNPGAIANASASATAVALLGAAFGDPAQASFSVTIDGLIAGAAVGAADSVNVCLYNLTGAPVNPGALNVTATIMKTL